MAREDLKKPRSTEEAQAWGRKGGIASGIARREKKTFRATLEALLDRKLDGSSLTGREAVAVALFIISPLSPYFPAVCSHLAKISLSLSITTGLPR